MMMSKTTQENRATSTPEAQPAHRIVAGHERRAAVKTWLLTAADNREMARQEWQRQGVALLRCGGILTAVRVPLLLVEAAAGTNDRREIGVYLDAALLGGAAFLDETSSHVYFLVPPTLWNRWRVPESECLVKDSYLGVPDPDPDPDEAARWLLDMGGPGDLCSSSAVRQLVEFARFRIAQSGS
ncbi:hypothetical protein [Streptomyces cadmiisoli]|uniref:hypothetical protein n=1 Tax=Streptomyces cadmiisoli TaxID=2184053 RepID=UPI003662B160